MWWRETRSEFRARQGERNRRAFRRIVAAGGVPGILAYSGREPVGWCAVEPRSSYPVLARSRILGPLDDRPAWAITCFFVARGWRDRGVTAALIEAAAAHARRRGARLLEAYPREARGPTADAWMSTGAASTFRRAGFAEATRRSPTRPVMRRVLR